MNEQVSKVASHNRDKLGLALSGGGFRASLFHLGVLRRMAELDLLRHVEVLSTVSGGSIIGALYVLFLKQRLYASASLNRDAYVEIVNDAQKTLIRGIKRNLRTLLFLNPLGILRVLLTQHSLGKRMARLYERYLYRDAVDRIRPRPWWKVWQLGRIRMLDVRFSPGGGNVSPGIEDYNAAQGTVSKIPSLILNATSLNSGVPFRFSSVEVGDRRLGFFRYDEIEPELMPRKRLLQDVSLRTLQQALATPGTTVIVQRQTYPRAMLEYVAWWRNYRDNPATPPPSNTGIFMISGFPGGFAKSELGVLRQAKLAAWYLRRGLARTPQVTGGVLRNVHLQRFWTALRAIDEDLTARLTSSVANDPNLQDELLEFIIELYYLRTAETMSPRIRNDWNRLTLGEAVGASACFPPVFPPFIVLGFYDDLHVTRLALTDGGVYDNMGITTLLEEDCTYIIASDTGGLFDVEQRVSTGRLGMSARISSVLMDDVAGLQRTALGERRRVSRAVVGMKGGTDLDQLQASYDLCGLVYFHINSTSLPGSGLPLTLDRNSVARLRTDLDGFGEVEIAALVNHGYDTADRYLRKYLSGSPYVNGNYWYPTSDSPVPLVAAPKRIQWILTVGRSRFFRALKLGAPVSWIFTLLVLGLIVWETWGVRLSVSDVITWLANQTIEWVEGLLPWLAPGWGNYAASVGAAILVAIAAGLIAKEFWPRLIGRFRYRYPRVARKVIFTVKWLRSFATNLLWLLGGAPVWIALVGSAAAWISYIFFYLPFRCKTRNR